MTIFKYTIMTLAILVAGMLLATKIVFAQEEDEVFVFDANLGSGAMICDFRESAELYFTTNVQMPDCGEVGTVEGFPVTIAIIGAVDHPNGNTYPLIRIYFNRPVPWGNQIQYSAWGGEIPGAPPELEPSI